MSIKKIFLLCIVASLCSCSTYKLANTVWYNVTPTELYGEKCNLITSIYFWDKSNMNFNQCLTKDTIILVPPTLTADGSYKSKGNLKKGVKVQMDVTNSLSMQEYYYGLIKPEGMVLVSPDSIAKVYNKVSNATLIPTVK